MIKKFAAIVLAAGKGSRMEAGAVNKVALPLAGKPMIMHTVDLLRSCDISPIIIVIGHAKESVRNLFEKDISFAHQMKRLGTANAVSSGLKEISKDIDDVLILQGDDSAFYSSDTIGKLLKKHRDSKASFTFLTIEVEDPTGLGRVVRTNKGELLGIVEEKDASPTQKKVKEINPACYIASVSFLKKYLPKVKKSPVTGEYYLTSLIDIGINNKEKIETMKAGSLTWRGVNTRNELSEAEKLIKTFKK